MINFQVVVLLYKTKNENGRITKKKENKLMNTIKRNYTEN